MVSLLSFFYTKKKPRRSGPPSPTTTTTPAHTQEANATTAAEASTDSSATHPRPPGRFLSFRHKAAPNPHDLASRRSISEISKRRSQRQALSGSSAGSGAGELLPKLDFEVRAPEGEEDELLGLQALGRLAVLRRDEKEVLKGLRWNVDDLRLAWEWFGKALRDNGVDTPGVMLPRPLDADHVTQFYLLALYALTIRPDLLPSFPSISAQVATLPSDQPTEVWRERLLSSIKDTQNPVDLAEDLKWILRRLVPSASGTDPLISTKVYTNFVQSEHASSYPLTAYSTMLCPELEKGVEGYLNEVFEVCAAIATRAEDNKMAGGRLAYLLGWWVWGMGVARNDTWEELYAEWQAGGKRMEHILYAWVRFQSTRQKMPIRLLEIVEDYPFGESSASSEHLPLPPPTSFTRRTLHVKVGSTVPTAEAVRDPEDILKTALTSKANDGALLPLWSALVGAQGEGLSGVLSEDSIDFLSAVAQSSALAPPYSPLTGSSTPTDAGPLYRPFSQAHSRKRSQSHTGTPPSPSSDTKSNPITPVAEARPVSVSPSPRKPASMGSLRPVDTQVWDDFFKSGFSTSANPAGEFGLALSPISPTGSQGLASPTDSIGHSGGLSGGLSDARRSLPRKQTTFLDAVKPSEMPASTYSLLEEAVIDVDDVFMAFVEDGQLDVVSASWPPFALVRLADPIKAATDDRPVEWLLVTIVYCPPIAPRAQVVSEPQDSIRRPTSPGGVSTSSRMSTTHSLRDFANSFRRTSSTGSGNRSSMGLGVRKSFFGSSLRSLSKQADLAPLSENELYQRRSGELRHPPSAQSLATEYTVGDMGEIIKIPSPNEVKEADAEKEAPVTAHQLTMAGPASSVSGDTAPGDWAYIAEGGAHVVFGYRGKSPSYAGKVIRIRKVEPVKEGQSPTDRQDDIPGEWRYNLLSKLLPAELLVASTEITLEEKWFMELLGRADAVRPAKRKVNGQTLVESTSGEGKGLLMEDTTVRERAEGHVTLAVEIKPKWGFLPDGKLMHPPESVPIKTKNCRFCMHQHLRGYKEGEHTYCPLDLYSGDETRMLKALEGLWEMWSASNAKVNNWRVFVDGHAVTPDQASEIPVNTEGEGLGAKTAPFLLPVLKHSGVLAALKALQQNLDPTDISDLVVRYKTAYPDANELFSHNHVPDHSLPELKEFVDLYFANPLAGKDEPGWTLRQRLVAYSLSAIFKDCSVFVKSTLAKSKRGEWQLVEGMSSVKVIDLDLKPIKNLRHWAEVDEKIWRHWQKTKGTGEANIEAKEVDGQSDVTSLAVPRFDDRRLSSATFGVHDNASTQALFAPTPLASPIPSPLPTATGESEVGSFSDALSTVPSKLARTTPAREVDREDEPEVEVLAEPDALPRQSEESTVPSTSEIEDDSLGVPRYTRSLAPSPSPTHAPCDIPESEVEQEREELPESRGVLASVAGAGTAAVLAGGAVAIVTVTAAANFVFPDAQPDTTEVPADAGTLKAVDSAANEDEVGQEAVEDSVEFEQHPVNVDIETVPTAPDASSVEPEEHDDTVVVPEEQVVAEEHVHCAYDGEKKRDAMQEWKPEDEQDGELAPTPVANETALTSEPADNVNDVDDMPTASEPIVEDSINTVFEPSVIPEAPENDTAAEKEEITEAEPEQAEAPSAMEVAAIAVEPAILPKEPVAGKDTPEAATESPVTNEERSRIADEPVASDEMPEMAAGPEPAPVEPIAVVPEEALAAVEEQVVSEDTPVMTTAEPVVALIQPTSVHLEESPVTEELTPVVEELTPVVEELAPVVEEQVTAEGTPEAAPTLGQSPSQPEPELKEETSVEVPAAVVLPDVTLAQEGNPKVEIAGLDEAVASMPMSGDEHDAKGFEPHVTAEVDGGARDQEQEQEEGSEEPETRAVAEDAAASTPATVVDPSVSEPGSVPSAGTALEPSPLEADLPTDRPLTPPQIPSITESPSAPPPHTSPPHSFPILSQPIVPIIPTSPSDVEPDNGPTVITPNEDVSWKEEEEVLPAEREGEALASVRENETGEVGESVETVGEAMVAHKPMEASEPSVLASEVEDLPAASLAQVPFLEPAVALEPIEPTRPSPVPASSTELDNAPAEGPSFELAQERVESALLPSLSMATEPDEVEAPIKLVGDAE